MGGGPWICWQEMIDYHVVVDGTETPAGRCHNGEKTRSTHLPTRVEAVEAVGSAHFNSEHVASGMRRFFLALLCLNRNRRMVSG